MNRPLALRIAPERLRMSLFSRYYRKRRDKWLGLMKTRRSNTPQP